MSPDVHVREGLCRAVTSGSQRVLRFVCPGRRRLVERTSGDDALESQRRLRAPVSTGAPRCGSHLHPRRQILDVWRRDRGHRSCPGADRGRSRRAHSEADSSAARRVPAVERLRADAAVPRWRVASVPCGKSPALSRPDPQALLCAMCSLSLASIQRRMRTASAVRV
jgi:hypothetical protein